MKEEDFTAGGILDQPTRRLWTVDAPFDQRVQDLVREWGAKKNPELIEEMIVTALKMARDEMSVADLKLINRSLKEMRYAAKVFAQYSQFRKVVVFGSARTIIDAPEAKVAENFARREEDERQNERDHHVVLPTGTAVIPENEAGERTHATSV